ncbi:VanZ family protein [Bacillus massilinigeriensis]|uniref:VanZ family protein n=1 Tax=Bacillus mediterraneensis TaxID=1805474 RepID=UPI0008F92583|nr:VanZ family protein [Bacillus mediterraneensis]
MKIIVWVLRFLPLVYMAAIWYMSGQPDNLVIELPDHGVDRFFKESLHLVEFGILYGLLFLAALTFSGFRPLWSYVFMGVSILYGLLDEFHQSFVPYRSATAIDFVKDVIGVLVFSHFLHHAHFSGKFSRLGRLLDRVDSLARK